MPTVALGTITAFAGPVTPQFEQQNGWLLCDGRSLDRTANNGQFQPLFNAIGSSWGGDGVNRFNIPDLRGVFLRGVDGDAGRDPDVATRTASRPGGHTQNQVGSVQDDALQAHKHQDQGHSHQATTVVHGSLPSWFAEGCDSGDSAKVNGNEGNQGNFDPGFTAITTVQGASADLGEPFPSSAGRVRTSAETRPANAYAHYLIAWK